MRYTNISVNLDYGLRLRQSTSEPLHHVVVVQKVDRNKRVKVRHLDGGAEGLEEFFPFRNVVVPWKRRREFLRNEECLRVIRELSAGVDRVTREAVQRVFEAAGELSAFVHGDGHVSADLNAVKRLADRAGLPRTLRELDAFGFVDDSGSAQLSFGAAHRLVLAFAKREPDAVTMEVESEEEQLKAAGYDIGERWQHDFLRDKRPVFALMRQWAGFSSELDRLTGEVQRLRSLVRRASGDLERAGLVRQARQIERALDGG